MNHDICFNFEAHLISQALAHPATQPRDIIKQCYQAAYGAEHLLANRDHAYHYLEREYASVNASDTLPLWEPISPKVCRVNLSSWKCRGLPLIWLFRMFAASASISIERDQATEQFLTYLNTADFLIRDGRLPVSFSADDWSASLSAYEQTDMTAVHHSDTYRQAEKPAYRILRLEFVRLLPILEAVLNHFRGQTITSAATPCIIAIDGRAASGKTTMADQLADLLGADVIRMDDFFLPPELRTAERLQTPGGNVHYERFAEEVLPHLHSPQAFSYRRFDCHIMDYNGERSVSACPATQSHTEGTATAHSIRIVEGSYSQHPALGDYADIRVFSHVDPDTQRQRILRRNGPQMAEMFRARWIPMEERYFREYGVDNSCHIVIDGTDLF